MSSWKDNIRKVTPYTPGEQPKISDVIKLNTNECPYPPSPLVTEMIEKMDTERFRLYPDPEASLLVNELAEYYNVKPEQVFVGVGSDDVLGMAFLTCFNSEKSILFPDITYSFYDVWAELFKIPYKTVALDEQFKINPWDFNKENGGIIFPNPNAPTAIEMPLEQVEEVIKNNPDVVVIVDEAYVDFGGYSCVELLKEYDEIVFIPMSSGLSGTCQTAMMLADDYDGKVQVVDNQRISVTMKQSVFDAYKLAGKGYTATEIKKILERDKMESSIYITLETLKYLRKGGRITAAAAAIGTVLNIKPVLQIQGEKLDAFAKSRGKSSAKKIMIKAMKSDMETRFKEAFEQGKIHMEAAYTGRGGRVGRSN